ncbi:MAG: glycosyltransferase family 4 protein [Caldilineaceae bacterium]|nr:glycosyltransferase family 4 protein [Caldilineaceae bacterium]
MSTAHYILDARTATAHFPGIGRYTRNLAAAMVGLLSPDEELSILWNPNEPSAWNPTPLANSQVRVISAPASPFSLRQQWMIPALLRRTADGGRRTADSSIDPVLSPQSPVPLLYHSTYYLMPYRPGAPTILTLYDLIAMLHAQTVSLRARLLFRLTTGLALRTAQQVIAISESTRQDLLRHFPMSAHRVTAIPLAADPRFQPQPPNVVESARRKYNLPDHYLFYLGINKPHKNLVRLIEAYARLSQSQVFNPPYPLIIAGAWDARYPEPKERAASLGLADQVRFLGPVDDADLPALYSGCTLFVFPSLYEGFGLPVLEAMACGAAVMCSNASSLPEVARDAALLFDPLDVEAIAAALRRGIEDADLRRSLVEQSLAVAARFSWARTAAETLTLYRQMDGQGHLK